jgi:hypothetical protein
MVEKHMTNTSAPRYDMGRNLMNGSKRVCVRERERGCMRERERAEAHAPLVRLLASGVPERQRHGFAVDLDRLSEVVTNGRNVLGRKLAAVREKRERRGV